MKLQTQAIAGFAVGATGMGVGDPDPSTTVKIELAANE